MNRWYGFVKVRWLFLALAVFIGLSWNRAVQAQPAPHAALQGLREFLGSTIEVHKRHERWLHAHSDVVGSAVGLTADGLPAIKVFTKGRGVMNLPTQLDGVAVEAEATGEFFAFPESRRPAAAPTATSSINPKSRFARPVPIGVSTGNRGECSAGTIGARVKDSSGKIYALSNNHVYALENSAAPGSQVLQPGLFDTNCSFNSANVIGTLSNFVSIDFSTTANNMVDAAIALSNTSQLGNATPSNGYGAPSSSVVSAFVNQGVKKYGRTTSLTTGQVTGINATILIGYGSGTARFVNQIVVGSSKAFILAGDSGSLLVTNTTSANPVGLLFAGNANGRTAIANPIDLVLNSFSVTVDGK